MGSHDSHPRTLTSVLISGLLMVTAAHTHAQIELIGSCEVPSGAYFVEVQGDYAYVIGCDELLSIIDVSEPANPHIIASYDTVGTPWGTDVNGGYAFLANGNSGLFIIDVSDPIEPVFTGYFFGSVVHHAVVALKDIVYLQTCRRFYTIDISDPSDPIEISNISTAPPDARGLFVGGDYAYIIRIEYGLQIIQIADPAHLELRGTYSDLCVLSEIHTDLIVKNSFAYIPTCLGLQIMDVTDPDNPGLVGSYDSTYIGERMCYGDDHLFLASHNDGLRILNVSIPVSPYLVLHYDLSVYRDVSYLDGLIYALNGHRLDIFAFESLEIENENHMPDRISYLRAYPNPFNLSTAISYSLPEQGDITLSIYNLLGQRVAILFEGIQQAGEHSITWDASGFPSGVYFARLEAGGQSQTVKMMLLR